MLRLLFIVVAVHLLLILVFYPGYLFTYVLKLFDVSRPNLPMLLSQWHYTNVVRFSVERASFALLCLWLVVIGFVQDHPTSTEDSQNVA